LDGLDERKVGVIIDEQRGFRGSVSFEVALPLIPSNSFPLSCPVFWVRILKIFYGVLFTRYYNFGFVKRSFSNTGSSS